MSSPENESESSQTPVKDLLTVVITTSPTPSAPSTELLAAIISSFRSHCPSLLSCDVIFVLDTFGEITDREMPKRGFVTEDGAARFSVYKERAKQLILDEYFAPEADSDKNVTATAECELSTGHGEAEFGCPFPPTNFVPFVTQRTRNGRVTLVEASDRLGFGLAVRTALRLATTPYVWIQQHDWPLAADIPLEAILGVMRETDELEDGPVRYICLPAIRMLSYATSPHAQLFPALRETTARLKRDFSSRDHPDVIVPLTPLFFWHDKPHVASRRHYLARIFPSRLAVGRGDFIEDKVGHRARDQMKEGMWAKWACWLYYPDEGRTPCVRHLNGRKWKGSEAVAEKREILIRDGVWRID